MTLILATVIVSAPCALTGFIEKVHLIPTAFAGALFWFGLSGVEGVVIVEAILARACAASSENG